MKIYNYRQAFTEKGMYYTWDYLQRYLYTSLRKGYEKDHDYSWDANRLNEYDICEFLLKLQREPSFLYSTVPKSKHFLKIPVFVARKISLSSLWYMANTYACEPPIKRE